MMAITAALPPPVERALINSRSLVFRGTNLRREDAKAQLVFTFLLCDVPQASEVGTSCSYIDLCPPTPADR